MLGDHIIILSSFKAANDLLTKRGSTYSNRPDSSITEDVSVLPPFPCVALLFLIDARPGWVGGVQPPHAPNQEASSGGAEV